MIKRFVTQYTTAGLKKRQVDFALTFTMRLYNTASKDALILNIYIL